MTRLTALELCGFKSFADRTRFEFPAGITAVVGPNGSGKSNVVDAIKWVLGEQSVRSLRGRDMTDVIFAGSGGRKPLNAAEVSLFFDNAAGLLPVDAPQVQITRRVYRSGESEYLVNGEPGRLRDIRELFSGTGAATEAYSVIEQGRVDALLVASGRDRRAVFEEAAGITRFRARRTEALRRLERSEQNRQRLADIVGEVSARLETVRHQAARARRWQQMTDRLRHLRLAAAGRDLAAVDAAVAAVEAALAAARDRLAAAEAASTAAAGAAAALTEDEARLAPDLEAIRVALATDTRRAAAAEAALAVLWKRRRDEEHERGRMEEELVRADRDGRAAVAADRAARLAAEAIAAESHTLAERLEDCERAAAGSHRDSSDARHKLEDRAAAVDALDGTRRTLQSDLDRAATRAEESVRVADGWRGRLDAARLQAARVAESIAVSEGNVASLADRLAAADRDQAALEDARRDRADALAEARRELAGWQAKLEACRERRTLLAELAARQEGYSDAARRLLAATAPGKRVPGLVGPLADLFVADAAWAPLVDVVLGVLGQSLVVRSLDDLVRWHSTWAATDAGREVLAAGGRIGFIGAVREPARPEFDAADSPGVVGRLDRLVGIAADRPGVAAVAGMLARVWVVESLADAAGLAAAAPPGTLFATRDGATLSADGVLELGSAHAASGLVARQSERRALDQRHDELERTLAAAAAAVRTHEDDLAAADAALRQAAARRAQAAERIAESHTQLDRMRHQHAGVEEAIAGLEASLHEAERHAVALAGGRDAAAAALAGCDERLSAARAALARARAEIDTLDRSRGELVEEMHRLRIGHATCLERLARARDEVATRAAAAVARADAVAVARARTADAAGRLAALDLELLATGADRAEACVAAERSGRALEALAARQDRVARDRRAAAAAVDAARAEATSLAETIHARELEAGDARHRRARITERIREDYLIDADAIAAEIAAAAAAPAAEDQPAVPAEREALEAEIETLRRKLSTMTSVNMEALAESEALTERLAGLQAQLDDVTNAKRSIEQLVARIDDESRRLLAETIETVRGHFRELFERVFGGGQADIVLESGVDLLEASVEIVSRPPGKEPRSISLLSGGEKTMTCVALLLAIFKSRPSPFCVLDEVDAALDESNVDRFAGVLRDFLSSTQFIVVTHSKKTMAAADTLYGVTMEESGVSKRIAVRFEATAAAAAPAVRRAA